MVSGIAVSYNHMVRCSILVYADVMIMKTKLWLRCTDWKNQAFEGRVIIFVINSIICDQLDVHQKERCYKC